MILNIFVFLLIFLAPFNLFLKAHEHNAYVNGIFVDYLVIKIYLAEIIVLGFFIWWLIKKFKWKKLSFELLKLKVFFAKNLWLLIIATLLLLKQFFTPKPIIAIWQLIRFFEFGFLGFLLWKLKNKINFRVIEIALISTIVFQITIGFIQFWQQKPILPYRFFGETQFNKSFNIAKINLAIEQKIPPYGTTAHPNILAGVLTIYGMIFLELLTKTSRKKSELNLFESWVGVGVVIFVSLINFLTQSYSAILAFGIFLIFKTLKPIKIKKYWWRIFLTSLIVIPIFIVTMQKVFPENTSLTRRTELNKQAVQMFLEKPLLGVGMGQFTNYLDRWSGEVVSFVQPAHHIALLWSAETGIVGILLIIWILTLVKKRANLNNYFWPIILLPIITLDHYLLTQWVGLWLLTGIAVLITEPR